MMRKAIFLAGIFLAFALAAIGYWMLFSNFAIYDDEGYILISAREYYTQGKLYETVYGQYGPAFYVLMDLLQRALAVPVDHTLARLLTLALWLGTAGSCALLVWRQTASRSLCLFTLSATFFYLYFITDEPFHPGSLIIFLLAGSLSIVTGQIGSGRLAFAAAVVGCTGALLLLTKINVGVFYFAAAGAWAAVNAASNPIRRGAALGVIGLLLLLAFALMHTLLREGWVQIYLLLFGCGTVTLFLTQKGDAVVRPRHLGWALAAGAGTGLAVLVVVWLRGTSLHGLLEGVLLGPLRHPGNYSYPVDWRPGSVVVAGLSLALAVAHPWIRRRFSHEFADRLIVTLRLILAATLLTGIALLMHFRAVGAIFSYVAPLIWIWIVPLKGVEQTSSQQICRGLLAAILLLQYLHAYPVGGSQESWGTFLFLPLVALGLGDVRQWFARLGPVTADRERNPWWPRFASLLVIVVIGKVGWTAIVAQRDYSARTALGLPGAARLHLPEPLRTTYRILALNAVVHTDMLFSLPGMFSFNLWTDLPTPTEKNTTLWLTLLNEAEQKEIISALERTPRAGVIVQESLVTLMQANQVPLKGALWDYLHGNFHAAFKTDDFAFWVKNGRTIAPVNFATVYRRTGPDLSGDRQNTRVDFALVPEGSPIVGVEVRTNDVPSKTLLTLDAHNARVSLTAINRAGEPLGPPANSAWPLTHRGLVHVSINFDRKDLTLPPATTTLYLKGANGDDLHEVWIGQ